MATANILAALDGGARFVEGAICGIGGGIVMPTTMGSVGNFPTEDIVHMLNELGIETGVRTEDALAAARDVAAMLEIVPRSPLAPVRTRAHLRPRAKSDQSQDG